MNSQEQKFAQMMKLLSAKYNVELSIDWESGIIDFKGDLKPKGWSTLIGELTQMAKDWNGGSNEESYRGQ